MAWHKYGRVFAYIAIAVAIKLVLFFFFAWQFNVHYPELVKNRIFISGGDTPGYYTPCEDAVQGNGYTSLCRMPGLLPIYFLFRLFLDLGSAQTAIIALQFLTSALSVYFLARIAELAFRDTRIFYVVFYLYAFSSFVSLWDHYGYADSFAVSFLIISIYLIYLNRDTKKARYLLAAGFFLAWSVFFRPVHGVLLPLLSVVYFYNRKRPLDFFRNAALFLLFPMITIFAWTYRNYRITKELIPLQAPLEACYTNIPPEMTAIRNLIIAWGGDILAWSKGSAGMWFFSEKSSGDPKDLPEASEITSKYNIDSLTRLRAAYHQFRSEKTSTQEKSELSRYIHHRAQLYRESYRKEKPLKFYVVNRLRLMKTFMFPPRLDYLPFPAFTEMKLYHKIIKAGYLLLLYLVSFFSIIGMFLSLWKKELFGLIPFSLIITLSCLLGYVELRYLTPAYPFLVILAAKACHDLLKFFRRRQRPLRPLPR